MPNEPVSKNLHIIDVRDHGIRGDNLKDNTAAIQKLLTYAARFGFGARQTQGVIYFPPGVYKITDTVGFEESDDGNIDFTIQGAGFYRTRIRQANDNVPVFKVKTSNGNIRRMNVKDITFAEGSVGMDAQRMQYCYFNNVGFRQNGEVALKGLTCQNNRYDHMHFTEVVNDAISYTGCNHETWTGTHLGEYIGGIDLDSSSLNMNGGRFLSGTDTFKYPNGYNDMGRALFTVRNRSKLKISDVAMNVRASLINADDHAMVRLSDNIIHWDSLGSHDGHLIKVDGNVRSGETSITGNQIMMTRVGPSVLNVYDQGGIQADAGDTIKNSILSDNFFHIRTGGGNTVNIDDALNDPSLGNQIGNNTINYTALI